MSFGGRRGVGLRRGLAGDRERAGPLRRVLGSQRAPGEGPADFPPPQMTYDLTRPQSPGLQLAVYFQHVFGIIGVFKIITVVLKGAKIN